MLIIENGKRETAPAETARVNVLRNSLEKKRALSPVSRQSRNVGVTQKEQNSETIYAKEANVRISLNACSWKTNDYV